MNNIFKLAIVVALIGGIFLIANEMGYTNRDYSCRITKNTIYTDSVQGSCINGSFGAWQDYGENKERRVYNGTLGVYNYRKVQSYTYDQGSSSRWGCSRTETVNGGRRDLHSGNQAGVSITETRYACQVSQIRDKAIDPNDDDRDGIPNDCDADNDGIEGTDDGAIDMNNNGIKDSCDDSDSDGISDLCDADIAGEGRKDTDNDGIIDSCDADANNDGINDQINDDNSRFGKNVDINGRVLDRNNDGIIDGSALYNKQILNEYGSAAGSITTEGVVVKGQVEGSRNINRNMNANITVGELQCSVNKLNWNDCSDVFKLVVSNQPIYIKTDNSNVNCVVSQDWQVIGNNTTPTISIEKDTDIDLNYIKLIEATGSKNVFTRRVKTTINTCTGSNSVEKDIKIKAIDIAQREQ